MSLHRAGLLCVCLCAPACALAARPVARASPVQSAPLAEAAAPPQPSAAATLATPPELFVRCEDASSCPEAVGMLVVDSDPSVEPERCAVTLIQGDRVLTASHCLGAIDRHAGAPCARTWVLFPESAHAPAESIACARVVAATESIHEDALHQEYAILQLAATSTRVALTIDAHPLQAGSIVTVVSVTPHPVYGCTHALATRLCRVIERRQPSKSSAVQPPMWDGWRAVPSRAAIPVHQCSTMTATFAPSCMAERRLARRSV